MQTFKNNRSNIKVVKPNWSVSSKIQSFTTTRNEELPQQPYSSFNLATHVLDDKNKVLSNRRSLVDEFDFKQEPLWLNQQHTANVVYWDGKEYSQPPIADAVWTDKKNLPLVVMTADCLPLLICNKNETIVAAIHAGWKGLAEGIISKTIQTLPDNPANLQVWIGPSISQKNFEVDTELKEVFVKKNSLNNSFFAKSNVAEKYYADLVAIAGLELKILGVKQVFKSGLCTYESKKYFYSYRREPITGRMGSFILMQ